jgi:hypothetical protein
MCDDCEYDWEAAQAKRDNDEYQRGIAETKAAQEMGPAGSAEREAAYRQMEQDAYNRGDD